MTDILDSKASSTIYWLCDLKNYLTFLSIRSFICAVGEDNQVCHELCMKCWPIGNITTLADLVSCHHYNSEVSIALLLIPLYRQGNRFREVKLPVQVYTNANLGLFDSHPRVFLTTMLCQTPTIYQICSILKMTELFWTCVNLFFFLLTFEELFLPVAYFRMEVGSQQIIKLWPEKPQDESPLLVYEDGAGSLQSVEVPVTT